MNHGDLRDVGNRPSAGCDLHTGGTLSILAAPSRADFHYGASRMRWGRGLHWQPKADLTRRRLRWQTRDVVLLRRSPRLGFAATGGNWARKPRARRSRSTYGTNRIR